MVQKLLYFTVPLVYCFGFTIPLCKRVLGRAAGDGGRSSPGSSSAAGDAAGELAEVCTRVGDQCADVEDP